MTLLLAGGRPPTDEQAAAIDRRSGPLLLSAGAGSGKTTVLVERFVRSVLNGEAAPDRILAITFTDAAAGELRQRIRTRLLDLGERHLAQATESARISTIHGLCARLLRTHAVAAGLPPDFVTLDAAEARERSRRAFDSALGGLLDGDRPQALDVVAAYRPDFLQVAINDVYTRLRSAGHTTPSLPAPAAPGDLDALRDDLTVARARALAEMPVTPTGKTVERAQDALALCDVVLDAVGDPGDGALEGARVRPGNATALKGDGVTAYVEALVRYTQACRDHRALPVVAVLGELLDRYGECYAEEKAAAGAVDYDDLQLRARDLLVGHPSILAAERDRIDRIMVDELQDTSPLQFEVLDRLDRGHTFSVGDERQAIYGFRNASVALFSQRRRQLAQEGAAASLTRNFRSRPELIIAFNTAFGPLLDAQSPPLQPGRTDPPADGPLVEILISDQRGWDEPDAPDLGVLPCDQPWRAAEARLVADRVHALIESGEQRAGDVCVLLRAAGDMATYERALEDRGIPTLASGGRGFWGREQILDLTGYLRALLNPRDEPALLGTLASPLVGVSADGLALVAAARGRNVALWEQIAERPPLDLPGDDAARISSFVAALRAERERAPRRSLAQLLTDVVRRTGYDEHVLAMAGGRRRLANVRKLVRIAAAYEERYGRDVRGLVQRAIDEQEAQAREPDAPIDLAGMDAVRLMTIHAAKGLEFGVVVVADLGRGAPSDSAILLVEGDRIGLRLNQLAAPSVTVLDYEALREERREAERAELRRVLYVAATRARERLILSGSAPLGGNGVNLPMRWLGEAFLPDLQARLGGPPRQRAGGVDLMLARPTDALSLLPATAWNPTPPSGPSDIDTERRENPVAAVGEGRDDIPAVPVIPTVSYSALGEYARCHYRYYLQRILRLPRDEPPPAAAAFASDGPVDAMLRGSLAHELLEELDLRDPQLPSRERIDAVAARHDVVPDDAVAADLTALVQAAIDTEVLQRAAVARELRREYRFSFPLTAAGQPGASPLVNGVVDLLAVLDDGRALVVDYKTDPVGDGDELETMVQRSYATQRRIYALAALLQGAASVDVCHLYLERPDQPVVARYAAADIGRLRDELGAEAAGLLAGDFRATPEPHLGLCATCPGRAALCEHGPELTERVVPGDPFVR